VAAANSGFCVAGDVSVKQAKALPKAMAQTAKQAKALPKAAPLMSNGCEVEATC